MALFFSFLFLHAFFSFIVPIFIPLVGHFFYNAFAGMAFGGVITSRHKSMAAAYAMIAIATFTGAGALMASSFLELEPLVFPMPIRLVATAVSSLVFAVCATHPTRTFRKHAV